jgi:hypothetical protein
LDLEGRGEEESRGEENDPMPMNTPRQKGDTDKLKMKGEKEFESTDNESKMLKVRLYAIEYECLISLNTFVSGLSSFIQ